MKNKVIFLGIIVFICVFINSMNVYAISFNLEITGDKTVEIDKTIQLKSEFWVGNDMWIPDEPNGGIGEVSREDVTNESSWTSSNNDIAVVDSNGKVKGVSEGTVTIKAQYDIGSGNYRSATYEITVKPKSSSDFTGLVLVDKDLISQPALVLNKEHGFWIYLYNIPDTEKGNIKVTIDNENVAKITGIDLCDWEDGSGKGMIIANAKFLSLGQFTITATLNYNGKTYSDSYTNGVAEDSTKTPVNPGITEPSSTDSSSTKSDLTTAKTTLSQTGENATIMIIGIILVLSISTIMYKKYKNYKDIK